MNILVTGANGYIGRSIVEKLQQTYSVMQTINAQKYKSVNQIYHLDLLNSDHIQSFLDEELSIDIIIHVASKMASSQNVEDMSILYDNIKMYEHIAQIAHRYKPKKLINFSSIAVYPNIDGEYDENSPIRPALNSDALYGLSKFCGENIIDYKLKEKTTKTVHLRISQVYSDDLRGDRLYMMMKDELKRDNVVTVFGDGERVSNFIHKEVLIQKIIFFIQHDCYGTYNIGDINLSYKAFAQHIIKLFGNNKSTIALKSEGLRSKVSINTKKFNNISKLDA